MAEKRKLNNASTAVQLLRYIIVGGGAAIVQWGLLILLKELFGLSANLSNLVGFTGGLCFNYVISKLWVFGESTVKSPAAEFAAFALIGVVGLGINQGLIYLFDRVLSGKDLTGGLIPSDKYYLIGQLIATGLAFFWNFFARKYILYDKKEDKL